MLWKDPPKQGRGSWLARLEPLKRQPGKWALVYQAKSKHTAYNARNQLNAGRYRIPEGVWEFKSRKTDKGGEVYARYLGKENAAVEAAA